MKNSTFLAVSFAFLGFAALAQAYQVTGPVLEVTDSKIVVQKDKEKWELARTADTKITGELKVGSKVTIEYTMTASSIEAKPEKPAKPAKTGAATEKPAKKPK